MADMTVLDYAMMVEDSECGGSEVRFIHAASSSSGLPNQTTLEP
jgi:hypothetical protein